MQVEYYPSKEPFFSAVLNKGNKFNAKYNCFIKLVNPEDAANLVLYIKRSPEGSTLEVNSDVLKREYCFIPKGSTIFSNLKNIPMKAYEALRVVISTEIGNNKE